MVPGRPDHPPGPEQEDEPPQLPLVGRQVGRPEPLEVVGRPALSIQPGFLQVGYGVPVGRELDGVLHRLGDGRPLPPGVGPVERVGRPLPLDGDRAHRVAGPEPAEGGVGELAVDLDQGLPLQGVSGGRRAGVPEDALEHVLEEPGEDGRLLLLPDERRVGQAGGPVGELLPGGVRREQDGRRPRADHLRAEERLRVGGHGRLAGAAGPTEYPGRCRVASRPADQSSGGRSGRPGTGPAGRANRYGSVFVPPPVRTASPSAAARASRS